MENLTNGDRGHLSTETLEARKEKPHARMRTSEEIDAMPAEEMTEKRTRSGKLFSLGENLYQAILYPTPVHYQDKTTGEWREIDNTLEEGENVKGSAFLTNKANGNLKVRLSASDKAPLAMLENADGKKISWRLEGAAKVRRMAKKVILDSMELNDVAKDATASEEVKATDETEMKKGRASGKAFKDIRHKALVQSEGIATFTDILPGVDMNCAVNGTSFKDEIIYKTPEAAKPVTFLLDAPDLTLSIEKDQSIRALDEAGEVAFLLPAPFMTDGMQTEGEVKVSLQATAGGQMRLTYTPDVEWLKAAKFPVILDPMVVTDLTASAMEDNFVTSKAPTTVQPATGTQLRVAYNHATYGTCLSFMKFRQDSLPVIDSSYYVTKAALVIGVQSVSTPGPIYLREVLSSWNANTLTYDNQPQIDEKDVDFATPTTTLGYQTNYWYDISSLVRRWYNGDNNGFVLDARSTSWVELRSADNAQAKPYITINYMSLAGLEDYLAYESHGCGRAGTAHVSLYNGNLIFSLSDTVCSGSRMPISVSHYYNSCYRDMNLYNTGKGWKHSLQLTLHRESVRDDLGTAKTYYVFTDADGTRHYFMPTGTSTTSYEDMSGLSLKLAVSGSTVTIRDKGDNVMTFDLPTTNSNGKDGNYKLVKSIADAHGNMATIQQTNGEITSATDGAGRITRFEIGYYGLQRIYRPEASTYASGFYQRASGQLYMIAHEGNLTSRYGYDARDLLISAQNSDGRTLAIEYYDSAPYRVKKITESNGTVVGNCREYLYGDRKTIVIDRTVPNGKKLTYHFNDYGNVVSVNDELGYASFASYSASQPVNHPEKVSRMQRSVINLLRNHDFRTSTDWYMSQGVQYGTCINEKCETLRCARFTIDATSGSTSISQVISLEPGKTYTLSLASKLEGPVLPKPSVSMHYCGMHMTLGGDADENKERISATLTIPENFTQSSGPLYIFVSRVRDPAIHTVYLYDIQLEESEVANHCTLLENGGFTFNSGAAPIGWTHNADNSALDRVYTTIDETRPEMLGGNVLRLYGSAAKSTGYFQEIAIGGKVGEAFVAGGWAKSYTKPRKDAAKCFNIRLSFKTSTGAYVDAAKAIEWGEEWSDWQFASGGITAPVNFVSMRFCIDYENNVNYSEFGGMFLYRERFGGTFFYDNSVNLISAENLVGHKSNAVYDAYNNLISYCAPGKPTTIKTLLDFGTTDIEKKMHLVRKVTSPLGIQQTFTYDAYGNQLTSKRSGMGTTQFIQTSTTYSANQNKPISTLDARGKCTFIDVGPVSDLVNSITDANGTKTEYAYDSARRPSRSTIAVDGKLYCCMYFYENDRLTGVFYNNPQQIWGTKYGIEYDVLGNRTKVKIGDITLSNTVYTDTGDKLPIRNEYANGGKIHYEYDKFKRIVGIRFDDDLEAKGHVAYDASGRVGKVTERNTDNYYETAVTTYTYDSYGRPGRMECSGGTFKQVLVPTYDDQSRVQIVQHWSGNPYLLSTIQYQYDNEDRVVKMQYNSKGNAIYFLYDELGRIASKKLATETGSNDFATTYTYVPGGHGTGSTTSLIQDIAQREHSFTYAYDNVGNIIEEVRNGISTRYVYDGIGQVIRVNDALQNKSYSYSYDMGGNLSQKSEYNYSLNALGTPLQTVTYIYGDSVWKDKLTEYNGEEITYDAIGNPTRIGQSTYFWKAGQRLDTIIQHDGTRIQFLYDVSGSRTQKFSNDANRYSTVRYRWYGGKIVEFERLEGEFYVFYDALGRPALLHCRHSGDSRIRDKEFYYVHNAQGDVVALLDGSTGQTVAEYTYDAWGKQLSCTGSMSDTVGRYNPFRYRSYLYDEETGLYYLKSRYYNPEWGRFINADTLLTRNLFAYCGNNPVMLVDPSGKAGTPMIVDDGTGRGAIFIGPSNPPPRQSSGSGSKSTTISGGGYNSAISGPVTEDIRSVTNDDTVNAFGRSSVTGKNVDVVVTDLITGIKTDMTWGTSSSDHAHLIISKSDWPKDIPYSTDARPITITGITLGGETWNMAYGWIPYPHAKNFQEDPHALGDLMCVFNGSNTYKPSNAATHGNEAAQIALTGEYRIVEAIYPK